MSRIGNKVINLPANVTTNLVGNNIVVKGPKGELSFTFNDAIKVNVEENQIKITRPSDSKEHRSLHGTTRAIIANMVAGVTDGFKKTLQLEGVGYRASLQGRVLTVDAGYSEKRNVEIPAGLTVELPKNTEINISGINKELVGEFAANIRSIREPEPYKGKGIRYAGERVRRKEGKTAKK